MKIPAQISDDFPQTKYIVLNYKGKCALVGDPGRLCRAVACIVIIIIIMIEYIGAFVSFVS